MDELTDEIRARVAALGFELVDLRKGGSGRRTTLQVRIDRPDSAPLHGVTIDDCALVSRELEAWLDGDQVLGPRYVLQVSSPGVERPIRWPEHWQRFVGHDVRVRVPDRGRITATIVRVANGAVVLRPLDGVAGEDLAVPIEEARDATLVVDWSTVGRPKASHNENKERL